MVLHSVTCLATKDQNFWEQERQIHPVKVFKDKPENGFQHEGSDAVPLSVDMGSQCSYIDIFESYAALRENRVSFSNGCRH